MDYQDTEMSLQEEMTPRQEEARTSFYYPGFVSPETPNTCNVSEPSSQPASPPRFRIRRRRAIYPPQQPLPALGSSDNAPLPTIELPDTAPDGPVHLITPNSGMHQGLLTASVSSSFGRLISPPKTPVQQIFARPEEYEANEQGLNITPTRKGEDIERPWSAFSVLSDSSISSRSSSDTSPSFGESCTSPESDSPDPFTLKDNLGVPHKLSSPLDMKSSHHPRKRQKTQKKTKWTPDMDDHLWVTYLTYLSDPTVTPFKTLPGSAPPLGVCHRIARKAKKTWKGPREALHPISEDRSAGHFPSIDATVHRESSAPPRSVTGADSPDTIRSGNSVRSHSSHEIRKSHARWPRSESSTRRRLRELCKHKPMLPPHYQRLMQTRSPSPFESSSSRSRGHRSSRLSPQPISSSHASSFSTRDLNITLATSTSITMQPGNVLSQLASDAQTPRQADVGSSKHSSVRGAHQKSQSLQLELGLGVEREQFGSMRKLASPFQELSKMEDSRFERTDSYRQVEGPLTRERIQDGAATVKQLDSPLKIYAPRPMSGSMKRRAEYQLGEELIADDVDARRNFLEGLFRDGADDGHRRVRSRGFSMGAMRHNARPARHLSEVFAAPSAPGILEYSSEEGAGPVQEDEAGRFTYESNNPEDSNLAPPIIQQHMRTRRLGSPFTPNSNSGFSNTFPRRQPSHVLNGIPRLDTQQNTQARADMMEEEHPSSACEGP